MKDWILKMGVALIMIVQLLVALTLNYPPTEEQLKILSFFGVGGYLNLWILRLFCLVVLVFVFLIWQKSVNKMLFRWSLVLLLISPTIFSSWYLFPFILLKILVFVSIFYFVLNKSWNKWWFILIILLTFVGYNRFVLVEKAAIFNKLSFKDSQVEVTARFVSEDSLKNKIEFPLWWRRVAYNKYFFAYKQITAELLPYFDLESLFFQEVTPTGQKSMVMWYWPEMYVFIFGIYFWLKKKDKELNRGIFIMFFVTLIDFAFSEGASYKRLLLTMWPISMVMALAFEEMSKLALKKYVLAKWSLGIMGVMLVLAFGFNFYDLKIREEYWFDNRPLAFQFWYENIEKLNLDEYQKIQISSLVGNSKAYCKFYIGNICNDDKWIFKNFNLADEVLDNKTIYAGFAGEFVGPKFKNDVSSGWKSQSELRGISFLNVKNLRDTIANQYGNEVAVAVKN